MILQQYEIDKLRRKAFCASLVIESASSRIINLNPPLNIVRVDAKLRIWPRTIPIPRSSDAFSSRTCYTIWLDNNKKETSKFKELVKFTMEFNWDGLYNCLAHAKMVLVLPVPFLIGTKIKNYEKKQSIVRTLTRWPIEQQMWQLILFDEIVD